MVVLTTAQKITAAVIVALIAIGIVSVILWLVLKPSGPLEVLLAGGFVNRNKGGISRSTDGGKSWKEVPWPFTKPNGPQMGVKCIIYDGTRFFALTEFEFCTSPDGLNWSPGNLTRDAANLGDFQAISSNGAGHLVIGTAAGISYYDGSNWTHSLISGSFYGQHAAFNGEECRVNNSYGVFKTVNHGVTWTRISEVQTFDVLRQRGRWVEDTIQGVKVVADSGADEIDTSPVSPNALIGVAASSDLDALACSENGVYRLSPPGVTPFALTKVSSVPLNTLAWTGRQFVAFYGKNGVNDADIYLGTSDGTQWNTTATQPWPKNQNTMVWSVAGGIKI